MDLHQDYYPSPQHVSHVNNFNQNNHNNLINSKRRRRTDFTGLFPISSSLTNTSNMLPEGSNIDQVRLKNVSGLQFEADWDMSSEHSHSELDDFAVDLVNTGSRRIRDKEQIIGSYSNSPGLTLWNSSRQDSPMMPENQPKGFDLQTKRRRHFSLEEDDMVHDESSTSSNDSILITDIKSSSKKMLVSHTNNDLLFDLSPGKSFINGAANNLFEHTLLQFEPDSKQTSDLEDRLLEVCCSESKKVNKFGVEFPHGLSKIIASHILQEAMDEPYGIKGCVLSIKYEGQTALHNIGTLVCDPMTVPTFDLVLTLRQGQVSWGQRMARRLSFTSSASSSNAVSTSYKLVKKRKYRNN